MNNSIISAIETLISGAYAQVTNKAEFNELTQSITKAVKTAADTKANELKAADTKSPKSDKKSTKTETKAKKETTPAPTKTKAKTAKDTKAEPKAAPKKREEVAQIALSNTKAIKALGLHWEEYKTGYVLCGDTKPISNELKKLKGFYNPRMQSEGKWFFKADDMKAASKALKVKVA